MKNIPVLAVVVVSLSLASCATSFQLSNEAKVLRQQMSAADASAVLANYTQPSTDRGTPCLMNYGLANLTTELNYNEPIQVSGSVLSFVGSRAVLQDSSIERVAGTANAQVSSTYKRRPGEFAIDVRHINRVMIIKAGGIVPGCSRAQHGYLVAIRPEEGELPNGAEFSFNPLDQSQLNTVVAALTYFAPQAKVLASGL